MSADVLRQAYQALGVGDPEPLVSLMSDDMIWRARSPRWRFWRPVPQWRGPDEAREVLELGIGNSRRIGDRDYRVESVEVHGDRAAAVFSWTTAEGTRVMWAQTLVLDKGRIVRMQDFADATRALKAIRS